MKENIVITGMGMIGPCGLNTNEFWRNLCLGQANIERLPVSSLTNVKYAGKICKNDQLFKNFSRRLINKCDDFSKLSLVASFEAIEQADIDTVDPERVGIFIGNNTGGWKSSHSGLMNLHSMNKPVSPYMASNWFPAAVQGHLSLAYGYKGISKTVISDRTSGILAIKHAIKNLNLGKIDIAIVGGVEAPVDEWALHFYESTREVSHNRKYEFNTKTTGFIIAEGAGFIVLESKWHAKKRHAQILAEIGDVVFKNYSGNPTLRSVAYLDMLRTVCNEKLNNVLIIPACVGNPECDKMETAAINEQKYSESYISFSKLVFGNTIAAGSIIDMIIAIKCMQEQAIPIASKAPIKSATIDKMNLVIKPQSPIGHSIILSNGYGGSIAAVSLKNIILEEEK